MDVYLKRIQGLMHNEYDRKILGSIIHYLGLGCELSMAITNAAHCERLSFVILDNEYIERFDNIRMFEFWKILNSYFVVFRKNEVKVMMLPDEKVIVYTKEYVKESLSL